MVKVISIYILLFISIDSYACSCSGSEYKKIFKHADYVIIGRPIKNIHPDTAVSRLLDLEKGGTELIFKVEKILKGDLKTNEVIINQIGRGSCTEWMRIGEKYLVFGHVVTKAPPSIAEFNQIIEIDSLTGKKEILYIPTDTVSQLKTYIRTLKNKIDIVYTGTCLIFNEKTNFYYDNRRRYGR
jgi:hypothetical protein